MPRPINDVDRKLALRAYRDMRRAGLAPIAAAERVCGVLSDDLARHLDLGNERTADHVFATWRAAREYRVSIALRLDKLPYWQTGKVTYMPAQRCNCEHITHDPGDCRNLVGKARAEYVGAVCDDCARDCVAAYLITDANGEHVASVTA